MKKGKFTTKDTESTKNSKGVVVVIPLVRRVIMGANLIAFAFFVIFVVQMGFSS